MSHLNTIKLAKQLGYSVTLLYFWLNDVNLAIERVKNRVNEGGHDIPVETIKRRYCRGMYNFAHKFTPVCDYWLVIDNSGAAYSYIAESQGATELKIYNTACWQKFKNPLHEAT